MIVTRKGVTNYFYIFGGKDERSQDLIQGITLAGVLFDEVALMPESFVNQATGRCSVEGSKFWFNCNPEGPMHWFKLNWIDKAAEKHLLYLHFTMDDNLSLSEKIKERYRGMYTGVFYKRYILGLWTIAEGLIYSQFASDPEKYTIYLDKLTAEERQKLLGSIQFVSIGIDFGGNRSLTTFVATAVLRGFSGLLILRDHHIKGAKGDIDADVVNREFIGFVQRLKTDFPNAHIEYAFADSEAQYLINGLRRAIIAAGLNIKLGDSAKYEIVERIRCTNTLLNTGRFHVLSECALVSNGLSSAVWDQKAAEKGKDVRLDDFTSDIDILDATEYSFERFIVKLTPKGAAA
jgi:PBSX family phage terminase large subunit